MTLVDALRVEVERLRDSVVRLNQELDAKREEIERLRAEAEFHGKRAVEFATRIEAALALHKPKGLKIVPGPQYCGVCGTAHPCPTVKALKGEKP